MIANNEGKGTILIHIVMGFFLTCFIFSILILNFIISEEKRLDAKVYPNVFIDGKAVGYKTKGEIMDDLNILYKGLDKTKITVIYKDSPVATIDADMINLHSDSQEVVDKAYLIGRSEHLSSRVLQKMLLLFRSNKYRFETKISYDQEPIKNIVSNLEDQFAIAPKNALFTFENNRVTSFRKEEMGLGLSSDKLLKDIDTAIMLLKKRPGDKEVLLTDVVLTPEVTLASANDFNIEEEIGEGKSDFSHSIPDRIHNIGLAASKLHGALIPKDSVFSFAETIGDISSHTGYKPSYIIKAGRTVLGDGGGVCQVSTTIFRAALNTGLPIIERHAHAYRVSYYENDSGPGFDATIFAPTVDLKIKNDTPGAILIQTEFDKDTKILKIKLYGKKDGRNVSVSPVTISNYQPPLPPIYQDDPTLKKGVTKQVDFPASGARASFSYKVTLGNEVIQEKKFISDYRPWQAVYLVGQAD